MQLKTGLIILATCRRGFFRRPVVSCLQAADLTLLIRALHNNILRRFSLGTAIGFRIQRGVLKDVPAILVFVACKVHRQWLRISGVCLWRLRSRMPKTYVLPISVHHFSVQRLLVPGGIWCVVDVLEFSYFGTTPAPTPKEEVYSDRVDGLRGSDKLIGSGSQITDDLWYGIFAGTNPESFVRVDGAFIPFAEDFNMNNVTTSVRGVNEIDDVQTVDLQTSISSLIWCRVVKVGRSSVMTSGTIMAHGLAYNNEKGISFFTDFLVVGENQPTFDLEGDSGSLILLTSTDREKPSPIGIIRGGTENR
ncbi:hypothetical protein MLD38_038574 [Melastoma candidum]|uniref:Uncharacterized protein n=1 Tax=Melastoma candidum TaxID=119954 RepID=A0ACB9KZC1_9MYRT|nr:hypothetical protein MLD38_038574 [Melastoma candidum]